MLSASEIKLGVPSLVPGKAFGAKANSYQDGENTWTSTQKIALSRLPNRLDLK